MSESVHVLVLTIEWYFLIVAMYDENVLACMYGLET